jgi:hypothetical protein
VIRFRAYYRVTTIVPFQLIPRHPRQQQSHTASIGDARKHEPCTNQAGQCYKSRVNKPGEYCPDEHERAGRDADLPLERDRLSAAHYRQAQSDARLRTALNILNRRQSGGSQLVAGLPAPAAFLADDEERFIGISPSDIDRIKLMKRNVARTIEMNFSKLGGSANIDDIHGLTAP